MIGEVDYTYCKELIYAKSGGWLSDFEDERAKAVAPGIQFLVQGEESESLQSTGMRLS